MESFGVAFHGAAHGGEHDALLFAVRRFLQHRAVLLGPVSQVHEQRGIAAVIQDDVRPRAVRPDEDPVDVFPVFLQRLALDREDRRAVGGDGGGSVVLRGENVAACPAHLRTQRFQRLDQHRGLDGHVQRTGDARARERPGRAEFLANRHQSGHLVFGQLDFPAAEGGQANVPDPVVVAQ